MSPVGPFSGRSGLSSLHMIFNFISRSAGSKFMELENEHLKNFHVKYLSNLVAVVELLVKSHGRHH